MTKSIVTNFGADPTFASDSTIALNAALACTTDEVYWDAGNYKVSGTLSFNGNGTHIGVPNKTIITTTQATGDVLQTHGGQSYLFGFTFASAVPRLADAYLKLLDGTGGFRLDSYAMRSPYTGIHIAPGTTPTNGISSVIDFTNGYMKEGGADCRYVYIEQGLAVKFDGLVVDGPTNVQSAFQIDNAGDVEIAHVNLMHGGRCLYIRPGASQTVATIWAHDSFFDTSDQLAVFSAYGGGSILRCRFANCWFGGGFSGGISIWSDLWSVVDGITFISPQVFNCGGNGITLSGYGPNIRRVRILYPEIGNKAGATGSSGIAVCDGTVGFQLIGGHVGPVEGGSAYSYGAFFGGALPRGVVRDVDLSGNGTAYIAPTSSSVFAPIT